MKRLLIMTLVALTLAGVTMWWVLAGKTTEVVPVEVRQSERFLAVRAKAEKGSPRAQYTLAGLFAAGEGTPKDASQAMKWYRRAADRGHVPSQFAIGALYEQGDGIRRNYYKAAEWYELAANLGRYPDAQFALGQLYFNGRGVPHDYGHAIDWYLRAANQGHAAAQFVIGSMFAEGWGVKQDFIEAYKWLKLAEPRAAEALAVDDNYDVAGMLGETEARMNRHQISRGKQRVAEWRKKHRRK